MSKDSAITIAAGALGDGGDQMVAEVIVTGGSVSSVNITAQGTNYALNDVLLVDDADVGGNGGSGFQYTLTTSNTGVSTVTDISLQGAGYQIGDVLSVDDSTVGGGGGSGFQFTVNKIGFVTAITVTDGGTAFELNDTLILGAVGGVIVVYGTKLLFSLKIDDVVGAIPAHLFAGIWGTLIVPATNSGANFGTQLLGVIAINVFVFVVALIVWSAMKATMGIRLSKEAEMKGTDVSETGVIAYSIRD